MAVYSLVSEKELKKFLLQYNIGSLVKFKGILEGIENTNYKLETSESSYILTIFEKRVNPSDLPFFINLKNHLEKKKFSCPKPIKDNEGKYISLINNKHCIITSFLNGKKISKVNDNHCQQVGKMLALFHQKSGDFKQRRDNTMNYNQWKKLFLKSQNIKYNKFDGIISNISKELSYLKKVWPVNLPEGIIHADVFQDNVFFKDSVFSGLIDFYFSCNDFLSYDIALTINAWCFSNKAKFKKNNFFNLIKGYESLRPLTEMEKQNLSTMLRGAAIRILLTRINDYIFHPDGAYVKPKDPSEYYSILQFHQENNLGILL
jgi:homoserine kinase type II